MNENEIGIWTVEYTLPVKEGRRYAYNQTCTVASTSLSRALQVLLEKYPDATVHAAHKRGRGELLIDPAIGVLEIQS